MGWEGEGEGRSCEGVGVCIYIYIYCSDYNDSMTIPLYHVMT